ncbi:MAG TPA: glucokinase [Burkholderiales bacterium]|nr:glucokinase [Burkholderiales bacterium]
MGEAMRLVADIGGTNARFALVAAGSVEPQQEKTVRCADFASLEQAVRSYLQGCGDPAVCEAALDVATGITGDLIQLTNGPWGFSVEQTRVSLGLERLHVVNDFTALALAVPVLRPAELAQVGGGNAVAGAPLAVIGPGTGLGVSGLIPCGDRFVALQGEGGHVAFSPADERELGVLRWLQRRHDHVSTERVVSGMGLENLYQAACALDGVPAQLLTPDRITAAALAGSDAQCASAVEMFCGILGTAAANLVVTLGARGGCYIGGGIVPRLGDYFARSPFRRRFEAKGRFSSYVAAVPTWVILAQTPALRGLVTLLGSGTARA